MLANKRNVCAFFDVDETVWTKKSVIDFWEYYLREHGEYPSSEINLFREKAAEKISQEPSRESLNAWFYQRHFKNLSVDIVAETAKSWCDNHFSRDGFWNEPVLKKIEEHRGQGHEIVLVSGSFYEVIAPLAERVGATAILCAPLRIEGDCYTGEMNSRPMIGYGKAKAVLEYLCEKEIEPEHCYGYGDDASDIPFISVMGNPNLVIKAGDLEMQTLASIVKYPTLSV